MTTVSLIDQISCVEREIGFRKRVYPRWVDQGRMLSYEAQVQIERMEAVLATLRELHFGDQPALPL